MLNKDNGQQAVTNSHAKEEEAVNASKKISRTPREYQEELRKEIRNFLFLEFSDTVLRYAALRKKWDEENLSSENA
jgi:hypothetical protein